MINRNIFISTPISSFRSSEEFDGFKRWLSATLMELRVEMPDCAIYCAAERVVMPSGYGDPKVSTMLDLDALVAADYFVLIYPEKVASSALIELGYALAKEVPVLIVTKSRGNLPFMAIALDEVFDRVSMVVSASLDEKVTERIRSVLSRLEH